MPDRELFRTVLGAGIHRIRQLEGKPIRVIQDELGYAIGRETGGSAIEHWRKGNIPSDLRELTILANEIIMRTDLDQDWMINLLSAADFPYAIEYVKDFFLNRKLQQPLHFLRDILVQLYPDESSIRRILSDSNIDSRNINFTGTSVEIWHGILVEATNSRKIGALGQIVEREYSANSEFHRRFSRYAELVNQQKFDYSRSQLQEFPQSIFEQLYLTELILSDNQISVVPHTIAQLSQLERLYLASNQLKHLPDEITQLPNLTELDLSDNQLRDISGNAAQMVKLLRLRLRGNQFSQLGPITELTSLILLDLDSNQLTSLPSNIHRMTELQILKLRGNRLQELPSEIGNLTNLRQIDLESNQLGQLPLQFVDLVNLTRLDVGSNQLRTLPPNFNKLSKLRQLDLKNNYFEDLPNTITQLTELAELNLSGNQLRDLPDGFAQLPLLTELNLANNKLIELPSEFMNVPQLKKLDLRNNRLTIPNEILENVDEPADILRYYFERKVEQERSLNEAKVILVGEGTVGKTSLVHRLVRNIYNSHERKTAGIAVTKWYLPINDEQEIRLNIWDFGGQEIMHATHQFFLTQRSLYLLVIDARAGERQNQIEYWLKMIQSFGKNSPVLVVGNKVDEHHLDIDRRGLQNKYKNIKGFIETSCLSGQGIDTLREAIKQEIIALKHVHDKLIHSWFAIKRQLEQMEHDFIPYSDYEQLCYGEGIQDYGSQRTLIRFLHDLGIVLNYHDDPRLEETNVLNPEWVTNGVYSVLNSNILFQNKGVLEKNQLSEILNRQRYPREKHLFIIDIMRKFELCFDLEGFIDKKFLIPDLLEKGEPYTGEWDDILAFEYHYDVLPSSVLTRFIVRMHAHIHQNTYWRTGVLLEREGNMALIKGDLEDSIIYIWVKGPINRRRNFLSNIRFEFEAIHKTISGIRAVEKVPLLSHPKKVVDYQHLLTLEELGEETFIPEGFSERVNVKELLGDIASEEERRAERYRRQHITINTGGGAYIGGNVNTKGNFTGRDSEIDLN